MVFVAALAIGGSVANAQRGPDAGSAGPNNVATVRAELIEKLSEVQTCLIQDDASCARQALDEISTMPDLNAFEAAQFYSLTATAAIRRSEPIEAIAAYESVLALASDALPNALIGTATKNLATLYLEDGRMNEGLALYEQWFEMPFVTPSGYDHYIMATVLYQLARHDEAIPELRTALDGGTEEFWRESAYELLYALQISTDDLAGARRTVEVLNSRWPKPQWAEALERFERGGGR